VPSAAALTDLTCASRWLLQIGRLPPRDVWLAARDGTPPTGKSAKFVAAVRDLLGKQNQEKERQQQPVPSRVPMPAGSALLQMSKTLPVAGLLGYLVQANVQAAREATHHGEQVRQTWTDLNGREWTAMDSMADVARMDLPRTTLATLLRGRRAGLHCASRPLRRRCCMRPTSPSGVARSALWRGCCSGA
jgi:hypothetical protein